MGVWNFWVGLWRRGEESGPRVSLAQKGIQKVSVEVKECPSYSIVLPSSRNNAPISGQPPIHFSTAARYS